MTPEQFKDEYLKLEMEANKEIASDLYRLKFRAVVSLSSDRLLPGIDLMTSDFKLIAEFPFTATGLKNATDCAKALTTRDS